MFTYRSQQSGHQTFPWPLLPLLIRDFKKDPCYLKRVTYQMRGRLLVVNRSHYGTFLLASRKCFLPNGWPDDEWVACLVCVDAVTQWIILELDLSKKKVPVTKSSRLKVEVNVGSVGSFRWTRESTVKSLLLSSTHLTLGSVLAPRCPQALKSGGPPDTCNPHNKTIHRHDGQTQHRNRPHHCCLLPALTIMAAANSMICYLGQFFGCLPTGSTACTRHHFLHK